MRKRERVGKIARTTTPYEKFTAAAMHPEVVNPLRLLREESNSTPSRINAREVAKKGGERARKSVREIIFNVLSFT